MAACHGWGMTDYVYAPKDDRKHRVDWRESYDDTELDDFAALAKAGTLRVGFGISPGLSIDCDSDADRLELEIRLPDGTGFRRCAPVVVRASYEVPAVPLPWIGGFGAGIDVAARHSQRVDPFRDAIEGDAAC